MISKALITFISLRQCSYKDIISHAPDDKYLEIAPLRILSFDIECAGRRGIFPEAKVDPVIQIANVVTENGELFFWKCNC